MAEGWFCERCQKVELGDEEPLRAPTSRLSICNTAKDWGHKWKRVELTILDMADSMARSSDGSER